MTEPTFTPATEAAYGALAGYLRTADRRQGDWPLKRYLGVVVDQLGFAQMLLERADCLSPDEFSADLRPLTFYTNLAGNPSYEDLTPLPDVGARRNATQARVPTLNLRDGGGWAFQWTATVDGEFGGRLNPEVAGTGFPVPPSLGVLTTSVDVWAVPGRTIRIQRLAFSAPNVEITPRGSVDVLYTGPGFERLTVTHTVPPGTVMVAIKCYVEDGVTGEEFRVDCVQIVEGSTDYPYRRYAGVATGETSELVTPETADDAWLPWLAQLVGVNLNLNLTRQAKVDAIRYASAGWQGGTKAAVAAAAMSVLTGSRYVRVYDHSTEAGVGAGGEWDILLITRATETPDSSLVLQAVIDQRAKPAGVVLHHIAYNATWAQIEAAYPTWADWAAAGTWQKIEEAGL